MQMLEMDRPIKQPLELPNPITEERTALLKSRGIEPKIAQIDLEMVKMKIQEPKEGIGWDEIQVEEAEIEYKRFLTLCLRYPYPQNAIVPNKIMDTMWHYHILDTRAYIKDCDRVFGHYFHHFPYFGLRGEDDAKNLEQSFIKTKGYYEKEFGEPIDHAAPVDCWHACQNACWHACNGSD